LPFSCKIGEDSVLTCVVEHPVARIAANEAIPKIFGNDLKIEFFLDL